MALFAAADVPLVYLSVNVWRGLHPTTKVVSSLAPAMRLPFFMSLAIFSGLWGVLLVLRMRVEGAQARLLELAIAVEDAEAKSS
jgi:heme exporter protein C